MADVTITQADRDAAKAFGWPESERGAMVQAFAAHRMAAERAVVEWLRAQGMTGNPTRIDGYIADAIERGEHHAHATRSTEG